MPSTSDVKAGGAEGEMPFRRADGGAKGPAVVRLGLDLLALFSVLTIGAAAVATCADVVLRNLGIASVRGVIDLTQLAMMYSVFSAIAYAFGSRSHVAVTVLTDAFPRRVSQALAAAGWALGCGFMIVLAYAVYGQARMVISFGDVSQNLRLPMGLFWFPVVAGLGLSALASLRAVWDEFKQD